MGVRANTHSHETLPGDVVVRWGHQQTAGALVSVGEGGWEADGCLLQAAPPQHLPTAGTLRRHRQAEDLLLTMSQPDERTLHVHRRPQTPL